MKGNVNKCHLIVSSDESCSAKIEDYNIKNSTEGVKLNKEGVIC